MSPEFQLTLAGNKMTNTVHPIYYGSRVMLKSNTHMNHSVYLHSHNSTYPSYRCKSSSGGQQVTGFDAAKNDSNEWTILPTMGRHSSNSRALVKSGDFIRLKHTNTRKFLLTHNIQSPLTTTNQEVTAVDWNGLEVKAKDLFKNSSKNATHTIWKLVVAKCSSNNSDGIVLSNLCKVHFIHNQTICGLVLSKDSLPEKWGFGQKEINAIKYEGLWTEWVFDGVQPLNGWSDEEKRENEAQASQMKLTSFWSKLFEVIWTSYTLSKRNETVKSVNSPLKWPLMNRRICLKDRVYCRLDWLGNPLTSYLTMIGLPVFIGLVGVNLFAKLRGLPILSSEQEANVYVKGCFFLLCYLGHFVPFLMMSSGLVYFRYYLVSYVFGALVVVSVYEVVASMWFVKSTNVVLLGRMGSVSGLVFVSMLAVTFWREELERSAAIGSGGG